MVKGFVFGKFYPFHQGHRELINHARGYCDELTVLVCASEKESISSAQRAAWIKAEYAKDPRIVVKRFDYLEKDLPNSSTSDREISKLWSEKFKELLPDVDIVCTGEKYGDYVAEYMGIRHIPLERVGGFAASKIRKDIVQNWDDINPHAQRDLVKKVVVAGTESTGKSTLVKRLAERFRTVFVSEAGRDVVAETAECTPADLTKIVTLHTESISEKLNTARRVLFIDTDVHTTVSYGKFLFGEELRPSPEVLDLNKADLYLYLNPDAPYVQDGTRLEKPQRDALDRSHRETYAKAGIKLHELKGSYEERFEEATRKVNELLPFDAQVPLPSLEGFGAPQPKERERTRELAAAV